MKKIIHGKMYDTETAKLIGIYSHSKPGDFNYYCEELYRKRSGEYFLAGEGSCLSKYAVSTGQNEVSGSEKIIPLTEDEAKEWAEERLPADEYEQEFGEIKTDSLAIGAYIKRLREEAELTQGEISKRMGVSQPRVAAIERGEVTTIATVKQVVNALNIKNDEKLLELFKVLLNSGEVG
jgi:predicted XRE-type DNA-binding protein